MQNVYIGAVRLFSSWNQARAVGRELIPLRVYPGIRAVMSNARPIVKPNQPPKGLSTTQGPQQAARNNMSQHFAGAVPNALDARIAPDPLQRQISHQAHATVYLQGI